MRAESIEQAIDSFASAARPLLPRRRLVFHLKYPTSGMPNVANIVSSSPSTLGSTCAPPSELDDAARERVGGEQEERDADPPREHLVAVGVVLLLVGEVAQVPDRQERGAALDDALQAEGEQRQAAGPDRLEEGQAPLAEDVEEGEPEQPVHPPAQGPALVGRRSGGPGGRVAGGGHAGILCRRRLAPAPEGE